jgi:prevent-host-death family protein
MSKTVNIAEAKANLSVLVDRATAGEDIVIARKGKPLVRLIPVENLQPRRPGRGKHWNVPEDFLIDEMSEEDRKWVEGEMTDEVGMSIPRSESKKSKPKKRRTK